MAAYIEEPEQCRQLFLMEYFGQKEREACGICDVCLRKKKDSRQPDRKLVDWAIIEALEKGNKEIRNLANAFDYPPELVIERIRLLLDDGVIRYQSATLLALKKE